MNFRPSQFFRFVSILVSILLGVTLIWQGQTYLFAHQKNRYFSPKALETSLKSGDGIKPFLGGFESFVADMFWLKAVQYIGGNKFNAEYSVLGDYANTITDLDPNFQFVYHFAGLLIPSIGKYEKAKEILLKGEKNLPNDWQMSFDLGFLYFYYFEDYESAIQAYERCIKKRGCLQGARTIVETLRARGGKVEIAFFNILEQLNIASDGEFDFLLTKAEELGKLAVLQKLVQENPPQEKIQELVGKRIAHDEKLLQLVDVVEQVTQKKLVSQKGIILEELLKNPFELNPYVWDAEKQLVKLQSW